MLRLYLNRELSWLAFNERVLQEARDPTVPLLERLRFLSITASNLDEFFMVRVGGLHLLCETGETRPDPSGLSPRRQLRAIRRRVLRMVTDQYHCLQAELEPQLARYGIVQCRPSELAEADREFLEARFLDRVVPLLTVLRCEPGAFPLVPNLTLNLLVRLTRAAASTRHLMAIVCLPSSVSRFVALPRESGYSWVLAEDLVRHFVDRLFPGYRISETALFCVTRNADLTVREDEAADFMAEMEAVLRARRRSDCVRLELGTDTSSSLRRWLTRELSMGPNGVVLCPPGPLHLADFSFLANLEGFDRLRYKPWPPQSSPRIESRSDIFDTIRKAPLLLVHPYESFDPVVSLVQTAAVDPYVLAIRQILYRTSPESPIVAALIEAARRGKQVTVLVELRARFDESRNIERAHELEQAGATVVYGVKDFKVHAKVCLVVRREPNGLVRYVHFGTGNYNERTARLYSDISYMTVDPDLAADATTFFHTVTGYSDPQPFRKLVMAPHGLLERLLDLIAEEAKRRRQGQDALIMAKLNSLSDPEIIRALYQASKAGVPIRLNVRGICCLRPGLRGHSETITVTSIVDRFLEHSRIFYFHQGGEPRVFISSADWMPRNLRRRIELLIPILDPPSHRRLIAILETYFRDSRKAWKLRSDGLYERVQHPPSRARFRSQEALYRGAVAAYRAAREGVPRTFLSYRSASSDGIRSP